MKKISRKNAISIIAKSKLINLNNSERESHLLNWWNIDTEDDEFHLLSKDLQQEITSGLFPTNSNQEIYNPLITIAIAYEYIGATNYFLSSELKKNGYSDYEVVGQEEYLYPCQCCGYRTLISNEGYEICRLCNWENVGKVSDNEHISNNNGSINFARSEFKKKINNKTIIPYMISSSTSNPKT